jgi:hypothetical protein
VYCSRSGGGFGGEQQGVELVKFVGHSRGEGRASLAAVSGKVEGPVGRGVRHLVMVAPWFDRGACFDQLAVSVADLDG